MKIDKKDPFDNANPHILVKVLFTALFMAFPWLCRVIGTILLTPK